MDAIAADDRCSTCRHTGFVHYAAGGCSVAECACPREGTSGPVPKQRALPIGS